MYLKPQEINSFAKLIDNVFLEMFHQWFTSASQRTNDDVMLLMDIIIILAFDGSHSISTHTFLFKLLEKSSKYKFRFI